MKPNLWIPVAMTCVGLALAGCEVTVLTQMEPSGAGTLTTEVGLTPDEVVQVQSFAGETGGVCLAFSMGTGEPAEAPAFEEDVRGEDTYCVARIPFESLGQLAGLYQQMEIATIRELSLSEGKLVYDLEIDAGGNGQIMMPVGITWTLELPGKVGRHNADRVEGKRLIWSLEPGEVTEIQAASDVRGAALPLRLGESEAWILGAIACLCCGSVLVVVVLVVLVLRRKTTPSEARQSQPGGAG